MDPSMSTTEEMAAQVNGQSSDGQRTPNPVEVIPGTNLYVKNLADGFDDDGLKRLFDRFGTITSAKVMTEGGRSKGFGFVCFANVDDATNAMNTMNNKIIASKPLYVAVAQKKEERRAFLAKQHQERMAGWTSTTGNQPPSTPPVPQSPVSGMTQTLPPMGAAMGNAGQVSGHVSPHTPQPPMVHTPPLTQFGGMNNFMLVPQFGQAATAQTGYIFAPSALPTTMQQIYAPAAGRTWQPMYPTVQTHQGQAIAAVRLPHHVGNPNQQYPTSPPAGSIPLNPAAVRPVHLNHHQGYNTPIITHPPFTVPMGIGHTASVNSYQGVVHPVHSTGVAAYTPHHAQSRWGLPSHQEGL